MHCLITDMLCIIYCFMNPMKKRMFFQVWHTKQSNGKIVEENQRLDNPSGMKSAGLMCGYMSDR